MSNLDDAARWAGTNPPRALPLHRQATPGSGNNQHFSPPANFRDLFEPVVGKPAGAPSI
jgi:hypothetical protein